jgi:hypothetical protein
MKNLILLLVLIIGFSGCRKLEKVNGDTVKLFEKDDPAVFRKSVILYDSTDYLVKTPLDTFLIGFPFNSSSEYDDMKAKAISDSQVKDLLSVNDYAIYTSDSVFILAYYLQTGKCLVYDKHSGSVVKTVVVETFLTGDKISSAQGRRFFLNGKLFLETIDYLGYKKSVKKRYSDK